MSVRDALGVVVLLFGAFAFGRCSSPDDGWRARAEVARAAVLELEGQRSDLLTTLDSMSVMLDSLTVDYAADSAQWAEEHETHTLEIERLSSDADGVADSLRAHVDVVGAQWFEVYQAQRDSIETHYQAQILALQAQTITLWNQREVLRELVSIHQAHNALNREIIAAQEAELAIVRKAANPGLFDKLKRSSGPALLGAASLATILLLAR